MKPEPFFRWLAYGSVLLLEASGSDDVPYVMEANQWPLNLGSERNWPSRGYGIDNPVSLSAGSWGAASTGGFVHHGNARINRFNEFILNTYGQSR